MKAAQARILLTGATGGIGREAAAAFLAAGARVLLSGRSPQALAALRVRLARRHALGEDDLSWAAADLRMPQEVEALAEHAAGWRCNVLVHAAGAPAFGALDALDAVTLADVLNTNLLAPMLLTRALLPHLRRQRRAQVLCVGSVLGAIGLPGYSVYGASKSGLRGFAEALRRELAGSAVRVQYLGPRSTRTSFNTAQAQAYAKETGSASDSAASVAAALVQMLASEAPERFLGFPEKLAVRLNGLVPTALDGGFRGHGRTLATLASLQERTGP
ncbi:MAG TPA: SDR family oxidoreductase [Ramlibacter sp.]|uniref:SDR family oxidoreductase n=1 Tax=Ramlibacter sp. TaxID=1917967 RepID=UPI002D7F41CA|nr:SDR family oxidoreductase [Ramlibacter sp.]HET8748875.1 SDR family oxidoreductase [Ramlibacter sp.]